MKIHFLLIFAWKMQFCSRCRKSAPRPYTPGSKKYVLNTSRNVYTTQKLFLGSWDIQECVFESHIWILYRVLEKAPLVCKKYTFSKITRNLAHFFENMKALFPALHIFNIFCSKTILWINTVELQSFPDTFRAIWLKNRLPKLDIKMLIFRILKEISLLEQLLHHILT